MAMEERSPAARQRLQQTEGTGGMTKTPISVPDLRISPYIKAKAEPAWRFWGLYAFFAAPRRLR
jgi:hypothetical protein